MTAPDASKTRALMNANTGSLQVPQHALWTGRQLWLVAPAVLAGWSAVSYLLQLTGAETVTLMWLPNAVTVVALYFTSRRWWPLVAAMVLPAELLVDRINGLDLSTSLGFGLVNMVEATVAATILTALVGSGRPLRTVHNVAALLAVAATVPAVTGIAGGWIASQAFGTSWSADWRTWWFGDSLGLLVGVALGVALVTWHTNPSRPRRQAVGAGVLLVCGLCVVGSLYAGFRGYPTAAQQLQIAAAILLAVGYGGLGAAAGVATVGLIAVLPLAASGPGVTVVPTQFLLIVSIASVLFMGASRDTAELALKEGRRLTKRLAESNVDLSQFAYVASHDMKEPLRTIQLYSELLREAMSSTRDDVRESQYLGNIEGEARRLQALTSGLLAYSAATTSESTVDERAQLVGAANDAVHALSAATTREGAVISVEVPDTVWVKASPALLTSMIQNLVDNSIKYRSPERVPEIVISTAIPAGAVILTVSDNGRGITENNHKKVFEMFQRLASPGSASGSGIGLATVARIAKRCGASIAVNSDGHSGTAISITFPARPVMA